MPPMTARPAFLFAALAAFGLGAGQAAAHPHIFAEARLDVVVAPDATVTSMRNLWRFDDLFSSTVLRRRRIRTSSPRRGSTSSSPPTRP